MNLESKWPCLAFCLVLLLTEVSCEYNSPVSLSEHNIIPHPVEVQSSKGTFSVSRELDIRIKDSRLDVVAAYLSQVLQIPLANDPEKETGIILSLGADSPLLGDEGYLLNITQESIFLSANEVHGVFNGIQTLRQLLPVENGSSKEIGTGLITDYPRYTYRGSMLDVSRHFFEAEKVKRYIEFLAAYKMNVLHLHLTDDQGWRIEIKSKPQLTAIGSTSEVGGGSGGFYTQEQYREIVAYAAERFITVIPEIDMPGHTQAALASYAELNCDGKAGELYTGTEVGFSTLCTQNEATYEFVDAVIGEIAEMTPGSYIHVGGDESHVTEKEDYVKFINRVQQIVSKYGKTMIGWDEIAHCDIETSTVVQQWNSGANAKEAARNGNKVILSPATRTYMDMKYDSTTRIGLSWASLIEVDHGYLWDPDTINKEIDRQSILGIEAPLWTETVETMDDIEYLVFPRLPGYAEIGWSPQDQRSWSGYKDRLAAHGPKFKEDKIDFYQSSLIDWKMESFMQ